MMIVEHVSATASSRLPGATIPEGPLDPAPGVRLQCGKSLGILAIGLESGEYPASPSRFPNQYARRCRPDEHRSESVADLAGALPW